MQYLILIASDLELLLNICHEPDMDTVHVRLADNLARCILPSLNFS
jgi:hypothetical protein